MNLGLLAASITPATKPAGSDFYIDLEVKNIGNVPVEWKLIANNYNPDGNLYSSFERAGGFISPGETRILQNIVIRTLETNLLGDYTAVLSLVTSDTQFRYGVNPSDILGKAEGRIFTLTSPTGTLIINSVPTGATIYIDGKNTGKITNATITGISPGQHDLYLSLAGYKTWWNVFNIQAGQTLTINATLEIDIKDGQFFSIWYWYEGLENWIPFHDRFDVPIGKTVFLAAGWEKTAGTEDFNGDMVATIIAPNGDTEYKSLLSTPSGKAKPFSSGTYLNQRGQWIFKFELWESGQPHLRENRLDMVSDVLDVI